MTRDGELKTLIKILTFEIKVIYNNDKINISD